MKHIKSIFVYGTLRPDDISNAPWTKPFIKGFNKIQKAHFKEAIMFREKEHAYPSASLLYTNEHFEEIRKYDESLLKIYNENYCSGITGYVLTIDETSTTTTPLSTITTTTTTATITSDSIDPIKLFEQKLKEADEIEEYPQLYKRSIIKVKIINETKTQNQQHQQHQESQLEELLECFIYHRQDCKRDIVISSGDWLDHIKENPHISNQ